ncbi:NAD-dependent epimerase/dehydratase family protein [Niastella caeni]|uniref:NAD-dependent epimerase/dehydratase family protein n=1 Tax=Niastella caeni TaxID=2569763 RepID=A0A4S8I1J7_9BACT|nr:NAD-dependent epimerase/dehydratase family protein [Niastella caeni]
MKLLVLGSEGFIGSHAVQYFRSEGYSVTCADIVLKAEPDYLLINPELPDFSSIFRNQVFDVCINATGAANVQLSFQYPALDYMINTVNVYNILDSIRQYNPGCKFINLSSAAVYGNPASLPIKETHAIQPLSPYGFHKWYSEQICKQFHLQHNLFTISLRIFSAYGEGLKKQLFWDLHKKISNSSDSIEMFGTGKESRDFIYVGDIMQAIKYIIDKEKFDGKAINVASGKEVTIEEVVYTFLKVFKRDIKIRFTGNTKIGDPLNWRADITALQALGFQPGTDLQSGIQKIAIWLKNQN